MMRFIKVCLWAKKTAWSPYRSSFVSSTNISDFVLNLLRLNTLVEILNRKRTPWSHSLNVWVRSIAKKMENSVEAGWHLLLHHILPASWPLKVKRAFMFLCSSLNMFTKADGHPILATVFQNASLLIVSKVLSTKTWYRGFCCSITFLGFAALKKTCQLYLYQI